jgi:hypothetical protein
MGLRSNTNARAVAMPNQNMLSGVKPTGMLADQGKHVPLQLAYPLLNRGVNARAKGSPEALPRGLPCELASLLPCIIDESQ